MHASTRSLRRFAFVFCTALTAGILGPAIARAAEPSPPAAITEDEVNDAQQAWCDGLVLIGKVHQDGGDYRAAASKFIDEMYDFENGRVFFRPTLAAAPQAFRTTKEGTLAYFVGGDASYPTDKGFALAPWKVVRFDNGIKGTNAVQVHGDIAVTMGNVYLTGADGQEIMVDKVFVFRKGPDGKLRLVVHKSALPNGDK